MNSRNILNGTPLILWNLGLSLGLAELFPQSGLTWWVLFFGGLILSLILLGLSGSPLGDWIIPGILFVVLAIVAFMHRQVLLSMGSLANQVLRQWVTHTDRLELFFEGDGSGSLALILAYVLIQLLAVLAVTRCRPLWIPLYGLVFILWGLGFIKSLPCMLFVLAGMILQTGLDQVNDLKSLATRAGLLALTVVVCLAIMVPVRSLLPEDSWSAITRSIHKIRYDQPGNSMPEGNLAAAGSWNKSEDQALSVTMDKPCKLYLRGHIYNTYTGKSWKEPEVSEPETDSSLFYWLHEKDFYGQGQLSTALALAGSSEWSDMTIKNLGACAENSYLPYGYLNQGKMDPRLIGDWRAMEGIQKMTVSSGSLPQWYEAQKNLVANQDKAEYKDYLALEGAYREYVYRENLQIPDKTRAILDRQLGSQKEEMTMEEVQALIYDYLSATMKYDEEPESLDQAYGKNSQKDFLELTLEEDCCGYSVHYATVATLILRYYGVPARYVEGYHLTRKESEKIKSGEEVILTENHAHAWAEYYLDGVGFVPFEVTPGYIDPEDLQEGDGDQETDNRYSGNQVKSKDLDKPETEPDEDRPDHWPAGLLILSGVLLILLLLLLILFIKRRLHLRKFLQTMDQADNRESIAMNYAYAESFLALLPEIRCDQMTEKARQINSEARFSQHEMTLAKREFMIAYRNQMVQDCKKTWSWWKRLKLRLIHNLY